ncbi:type IX secretion system membrane protein PorP/SprF [Marinifilum fragile]|uniref:PorP/SprF family type IX secretion system membrane protein n=1 Tax=Marinifilum fragile TaxID=570161 RepID=UPI002AA86EED|nr:type IX secretion system membrane protein PorP/SprF [Marinifilum fragile]
MKKLLPLLLILFGSTTFVFGQQDKMFTQYLNYPSAINPAYVGSRGATQILGIARRQWVGIDGAPRSSAVSVNTPISFYNMGVGLTVETDKLGPEKNTNFGADFSYRLRLTHSTFLNLGLKAGLAHYKVDLRNAHAINPGDPLLQDNIDGDWIPNFGVGAYLYSDRYFVGLSIPRLIQTDVEGGDLANSTLDRNKLHYFLMAGYLMDVNPFLKLKPSMLLKATQGSRLSYDATLMAIFIDRLWLGASYRNEDSVAAIVQFNVTNQLKLGYSYDFATSKLSGRSDGSHEISLSYDIAFKSKKLKSPRYF